MATSAPDDYNEQENTKIDICMCLSVLLSSSKAAKTHAVEHNVLKKLVDIC